METLLHTPEIREADVAALLVQDQPYCRIQKAALTGAMIRDTRLVLVQDRTGRPTLTITRPAAA